MYGLSSFIKGHYFNVGKFSLDYSSDNLKFVSWPNYCNTISFDRDCYSNLLI